MSKRLVVYYSLSGNTKSIAEKIASNLGADIQRIVPKQKYNYGSAATLGGIQIASKRKPKIHEMKIDMEYYDEVIIGTPVWWFTLTPPVRTFLDSYNFTGKKVRLFSTHQGSNGKTFSDMEKLLGDAEIISIKDYYFSGDFDYERLQGDFKLFNNEKI